MQSDQTRLLEIALFDIRGLLADYPGSDVHSPMSVGVVAHLGYALHNEAEAAFNNVDFQTDPASLKSAAIDQVLGGTDGAALLKAISACCEGPLLAQSVSKPPTQTLAMISQDFNGKGCL